MQHDDAFDGTASCRILLCRDGVEGRPPGNLSERETQPDLEDARLRRAVVATADPAEEVLIVVSQTAGRLVSCLDRSLC